MKAEFVDCLLKIEKDASGIPRKLYPLAFKFELR